MGQAARRRDALRAAMLRHLIEAGRAPCPTESALRTLLAPMPTATVARADASVLAAMGMEPSGCHANARAFAMDVTGAEWVLGWWDLGHAWTLHSVVRLRGALLCVTPQARPGEPGTLAYVPDPGLAVSVEESDDTLRFSFARGGGPVDGFPLVRKDPDGARATAAALAADADPHAVRQRFEEAFG